jgi:uncharacterized OsmC-like protein
MVELVWDVSRVGTATAPSGASTTIGDDARFSPDDLLAMAAAGCHMRTFLRLAGDAEVPVFSYAATAHVEPGNASPPRVHVRSYVVTPGDVSKVQVADLLDRAAGVAGVTGARRSHSVSVGHPRPVWSDSRVATRRKADVSTVVLDYYRDEHVRARMLEYCGATAHTPATAVFVAGLGPADGSAPCVWDRAAHRPMSEIARCWDAGDDISRSLWDAEHLLFLLEIDYENIDEPAEPFLRPASVFFKLEPAYRAAMRLFASLDLHPRTLVTGRGYQFIGQVPLGRPIVDRLAALAPDTPAWFASHAGRRPAGVTTPLDERTARASAGLGLVIEHVAHLLLREATEVSPVPVVVNGTIVGSGLIGRECASIDFTHVGDPLDVRHMRVAFSAYQWHRLRPDIFGPRAAGVAPFVTLPRGSYSLSTLLLAGRGLDTGRTAARTARTSVPDITRGLERLLASYAASPLAAFHNEFYAMKRAAAGRVRPLDLDALPPCVAASLERPNDLLLKPEHVQHLVRGLMARGWHPADIAGLVRAAYEADHGWGDRWTRMHPETRADFDVRVFAGLVATGADTLVDFNCVSAQEKNLCPRIACPRDLRKDRAHLVPARTA